MIEEPGFYWTRSSSNHKWAITEVVKNPENGELCWAIIEMEETFYVPLSEECEYVGPLIPPS